MQARPATTTTGCQKPVFIFTLIFLVWLALPQQHSWLCVRICGLCRPIVSASMTPGAMDVLSCLSLTALWNSQLRQVFYSFWLNTIIQTTCLRNTFSDHTFCWPIFVNHLFPVLSATSESSLEIEASSAVTFTLFIGSMENMSKRAQSFYKAWLKTI